MENPDFIWPFALTVAAAEHPKDDYFGDADGLIAQVAEAARSANDLGPGLFPGPTPYSINQKDTTVKTRTIRLAMIASGFLLAAFAGARPILSMSSRRWTLPWTVRPA
jgi:hypothetical protein